MTALVALVVAASPLPADFWARELGTMQHDLAGLALTTPKAQTDPHLLLWADVLRFATCQPLPSLEPSDDPRRQLLRIEAGRLMRLGPAATEAPTIWRDLLADGFFSFAPPVPPESSLRWPIEAESWEGEHLLAQEVATACEAPDQTGVSEIDWIAPRAPELLAALGPSYLPAAHRLAYHRAVLAYRAGLSDDGRASAAFVDPGQLPDDLRPWFALLRLEYGLGDEAEYLALLTDRRLESVRPTIALRAAAWLARADDAALVRFTEDDLLAGLGIAGLDSPGARYLAALRATALERASTQPSRDNLARGAKATAFERIQIAAARAALVERIIARGAAPADANGALLEEFALAHLATLPANDALAALARYAPAALQLPRMTRIANFAMTLRRFELVDACAARLDAMGDPRGRLRALALTAESALLQNRTAAFVDSTRTLLDPKEVPPAARPDRDLVVQELVTSLATHAASLGSAAWIARVEKLAADSLEQIPARHRARLERAAQMLAQAKSKSRARPAADGSPLLLAFGSAAIHPSHPPPQLPSITFEFPEPFSLLALPAADGAEVLAWFPTPEPAVSEVPRAP